MEILYLLVPLAMLVAIIIALFFQWSVKNGQFDDLEGPAHAILMDDDTPDASPNDAPQDRPTSAQDQAPTKAG